ncbi:MAG TPA: imidazolonepropionase [Blastocatellia bacterium]|nr:imidazolonepropionase [Blastocatellia bacterium]
MSRILIANASQVVTLAGASPRKGEAMRDLGIIEDGAILVHNGRIEAVGKTAQFEDFPDIEFINAAGCVVLPGFVDAHTHAIFAGTRENEYEQRIAGATYQEIAAKGGGIRSTVRATRAASEEDLFEIGKRHVQWFLSHGTTTIEAKSGYGLTVEDELKILRTIQRLNDETPLDLIGTFLGAHEVPDEYRNNRKGYLRLVVEEMLPAVAKEDLAKYCDVFCESNVFSIDESREVLQRAQSQGLRPRFHADQLTLCGGAELAVEVGAVSADHLEQIDDVTIEKLNSSKVMPVLLPGSVFHLGLAKYAPARKMIDAGLPVVLATDFNPGSSPTPNMQMILSIACTQMRMTPAEVITASTINAAHTLGRASSIGTIEVGKQADLVIFDCDDYRQIPYFFGVNHARTVVKNGAVVYSKGE